MLEAAAIAGDPFEPDIAAEIAGLGQDDGSRDARRAARRWTSCGPPTSRAGSASGTRCCARPSMRHARPAGGSPPTAARPRRWPSRGAAADRARPPRRARRPPGRRARRSPCSSRQGRRARRAPPSSPRAGSRRRCGCCRRPTRTVRSPSAGSSPRCCAPPGSSSRAGRVLLEAIELIRDPADPTRIELTTRCAAVERWLGRDRDAHAAPHPGLGAAARGRATRDAQRSRSNSRSTASSSATSSARSQTGEAALATARALGSRAADRRGRVRALPGRGRGGADRAARNATAPRRSRIIDRPAPTTSSPDTSTPSTTSAGPRTISSTTTRRSPTSTGMIDIVRCRRRRATAGADAAGQVLPARDARAARGGRGRSATRPSRPRSSTAPPTSYPGRCSSAPGPTTTWASSAPRSPAPRRACASPSRKIGGAGPSAGIGPAWILACALIESGRPERAAELLRPLVGEDIEGAMPVERGFFWETLALAGDRRRTARARRAATSRAPSGTRRRSIWRFRAGSRCAHGRH